MEILEAFDLTTVSVTRVSWRGVRITGVEPAWLNATPASCPGPVRAQRRERRSIVLGQGRGVGGPLTGQNPCLTWSLPRLRRLGLTGSDRTVRRAVGEKPRRTTATATTWFIHPGSPNRACGPSGTGVRGWPLTINHWDPLGINTFSIPRAYWELSKSLRFFTTTSRPRASSSPASDYGALNWISGVRRWITLLCFGNGMAAAGRSFVFCVWAREPD